MVDLQIVGGRDRDWLKRKLQQVLTRLKVRRAEWTISVVRDREMAALHRRTMGIGGTTDVLTFDLRESPKGVAAEGAEVELDTVVCVDEARRRAREFGHAVHKELLLYCVHSLLHVQGYDDVTGNGAQAMHAREDELLVAIGVGPVYGGRGVGTEMDRKKSKDKSGKRPDDR